VHGHGKVNKTKDKTVIINKNALIKYKNSQQLKTTSKTVTGIPKKDVI
jgi:hypothetical protein